MANRDTLGAEITAGQQAYGLMPAPTTERKRLDIGLADGLLRCTWKPTITAADEVADVRALTIQVQDGNGDDVAKAVDVVVEVYEATMIEAAAGAFTLGLTGGGAGAVNSTTAQARIKGTTSAAGLLELDLTDVAGASGKTVWVRAFIANLPAGMLVPVDSLVSTSFN